MTVTITIACSDCPIEYTYSGSYELASTAVEEEQFVRTTSIPEDVGGECPNCGGGLEETVTGDGILPESWAAVDASPPSKLDEAVTPRRLQEAVRDNDSLFGVTDDIRAGRDVARRALSRLGLLHDLETHRDGKFMPLNPGERHG